MGSGHIKAIEADKHWNYGLVGNFITYRAISFELLGTAAGSLVSYINFATWQSVAAVTAVGLMVGACMFLIRRHRTSWMQCDEELQSIQKELKRLVHEFKQSNSPLEKKQIYKRINKIVVERTAGYFQVRLRDQSISCCLRLASTDGELDNECYKTVARSSRMLPVRSEKSQPIMKDEGVAKAFLSDLQGVVFIHDFKDAVDKELWKEMDNDSLHDVNSMMIAPITSWFDGNLELSGMIFVGSKKERVFQPAHGLPILFTSEFLGLLYPTLDSSKRKKNSSTVKEETVTSNDK